jgi:hypothetical protein
MRTKAKVLFVLLFLISPFQNIYNQNRDSDTTIYFQRPDSTHLKISFNDKNSIRFNFSLALKLKELGLSKVNGFNSQSYSDFYQNTYGIALAQKDDIDKNLIAALQKTLPPREDETITAIRKYLGISQDIFVVILALIHLAKYY